MSHNTSEHDKVHNLEQELISTDWLVEKVRASDTYAQNLYAALCNNQFMKNKFWPILANIKWSCSWRYAGEIIADIRNVGDYMDWYCSGIDSEEFSNEYVREGTVTEEIREDLKKLDWIIKPYTEE